MPLTQERKPLPNADREDVIVAVRFSALGDVALTLPVLYDICRNNPSQRFVMLTKQAVTGLFVNPPANLEVIGVDLVNDYRGATGMMRLMASLRRRFHIVAFADLHSVLRTRLLSMMARLHGARVATINKGRRDKKRLLGRSLFNPSTLTSTSDRYREVFSRLGLTGTGDFTTIGEGIPHADISSITAEKRPGERWIAIAPFAAHLPKIYPADLMKEVVDSLATLPDVRLFFFGAGEKENEQINNWCAPHANATSLAGRRLGFATELELLRRMDVMLSMDSANLHLATLAGAPTVTIWGATHPCFGFAGNNPDPARQLGVALECRPCSVFGNKPCRRGDLKCLRSISPQQVVATVSALLHNRSTDK